MWHFVCFHLIIIGNDWHAPSIWMVTHWVNFPWDFLFVLRRVSLKNSITSFFGVALTFFHFSFCVCAHTIVWENIGIHLGKLSTRRYMKKKTHVIFHHKYAQVPLVKVVPLCYSWESYKLFFSLLILQIIIFYYYLSWMLINFII